MSDLESRTESLAERGEPPMDAGESIEQPLEFGVGSIVMRRRRGVESSRVAVELSPEQLGQLALQFAAVVAQKEEAPPPDRPMLGELSGAWLERIRTKRVKPKNEERLAQLLRPLYLEDEATLSASGIEDHLAELLRGGLSPTTVNKVLATGRRIVAQASRNGACLDRRK
jgi:hypothetical protein